VLVETLFHWNGVGTLIFNAASHKDFSMLEAGVLVIGAAYMVFTLVADILYSLLNPRVRLRGAE
jgi:peptide/nickel transport system permease protein